MSRATIIGLLLFAAVPAQAADTWTAAVDGGKAVMSEISTVRFRATNDSTSTNRLTTVRFGFKDVDYGVEGGEPPAGWLTLTIDKNSKTVTFIARDPCVNGIEPGKSLVFGVRVVGQSVNSDVTDELFTGGSTKTWGTGSCGGTFSFGSPTVVGGWRRVGLGGNLTVTPRSLPTGQLTTVELTVTNNSGTRQAGILPVTPTTYTSGQFSLETGASQTAIALDPGNSGVFRWTFRSQAKGIFVFYVSATNGTVSTGTVDSAQGDIGDFPALTEVYPALVTSGQSVAVTISVTNNSGEAYRNVQPDGLTYTGSATATLVSGPTPSLVGNMPRGTTVSFRYVYSISGMPGTTYAFSGKARATKVDNTVIYSDPVSSAVGVVGNHAVSINPVAVLTNSSNVTVTYDVANGSGIAIKQVMLLTPDTYYFVAPVSFVNVPANWTAVEQKNNPTGFIWSTTDAASMIQPAGTPGDVMRFSVTYARVGPVQLTNPITLSHRMVLTMTDGMTARVDAPISVSVFRIPSDIDSLTLLASNASNTLFWSNPVGHDGVLILRQEGSAVTSAPSAGRFYSPDKNDYVGTAKVVYSDSRSFVSTFTDTGVSNGTTYYYKVFSHDAYFNYASGNVPGPIGIWGAPSAGGTGQPKWCYSVGYDASQQPVAETGAALFSSNQANSVTANLLVSSDPASDGGERWRPLSLGAAIESRFQVLKYKNRSGTYIALGTKGGIPYFINAQTGTVVWTGPKIGDAIISQPAIQLYDSSNAAFKAANPNRDVLFFATRNNDNTSNKVYAFSSVDGSQVWPAPFAPGNLDIVSGILNVDKVNNRLWVASRTNGSLQPSVRILNSLTGAEEQPPVPLKFGDADNGVAFDWDRVTGAYNNALLVTNAGQLHVISLSTLAVRWTVNLGAPATTHLLPVGSGFMVTLGAPLNRVERWSISATGPTQIWYSTTIPNPGGLNIDYVGQKVMVGAGDGTLHQVNGYNGFDEGAVAVTPGQALGAPIVDRTPRRVHVGTLDGRICTFQLPLF